MKIELFAFNCQLPTARYLPVALAARAALLLYSEGKDFSKMQPCSPQFRTTKGAARFENFEEAFNYFSWRC